MWQPCSCGIGITFNIKSSIFLVKKKNLHSIRYIGHVHIISTCLSENEYKDLYGDDYKIFLHQRTSLLMLVLAADSNSLYNCGSKNICSFFKNSRSTNYKAKKYKKEVKLLRSLRIKLDTTTIADSKQNTHCAPTAVRSKRVMTEFPPNVVAVT